MDKLLVGTRQKSTPGAVGLVQKVKGITGYFTKPEGHKISVTIKKGFFIWIAPPDTGDQAIEKLECLFHKRPSLSHVVILLRLFPYRW